MTMSEILHEKVVSIRIDEIHVLNPRSRNTASMVSPGSTLPTAVSSYTRPAQSLNFQVLMLRQLCLHAIHACILHESLRGLYVNFPR